MKHEAIDIEQQVLGSFLNEPKCVDEIISLITPETFVDKRHRVIFKEIMDAYNEGINLDVMIIRERLLSKDELDYVGGTVYLGQLLTFNYQAKIRELCEILSEKWMLRKIISASKEIEKAANNGSDPFEILNLIGQQVYEIENRIDSFKPDKTIWGEFDNLIELVEKKLQGKIPAGLMCDSFPTLNKATGGLMSTDLLVIYGKDKSGKSTFTERLVLDFAFQKIPIGIFPMEMDFETYSYRALSLVGDIEYLKLRNPRGQSADINELHEFYKRVLKFKETKIVIDDLTFDFERMLSKAKLWKRKHKIGLFVFDYLGLIRTNRNYERRDLQLSDFTGRLKNLAKELQTPIVVVSQANEEKKTADSKGAMRDGDFAVYMCKPLEDGIKSIKNKYNEEFKFTDDHFFATIERSRHGRAKQNFVCGYQKNNFIEIKIDEREPMEEYLI